MAQTNRTVKIIAQFRPLANQTNSVAKSLASAYRRRGVVTAIKIVMTIVTRRIVKRKNVIRGCFRVGTVDAFTIRGNAVSESTFITVIVL